MAKRKSHKSPISLGSQSLSSSVKNDAVKQKIQGPASKESSPAERAEKAKKQTNVSPAHTASSDPKDSKVPPPDTLKEQTAALQKIAQKR